MYTPALHRRIEGLCDQAGLKSTGADRGFFIRLMANAGPLHKLYSECYGRHPGAETCFDLLITALLQAWQQRDSTLRARDEQKEQGEFPWFLHNELAGMSLYVDRFCGTLAQLPDKLGYLQELGVNLLHLMPIFQSPEGESDGGYAVSDFRKVDPRFGTLEDLQSLRAQMGSRGMYLMLDIVLNHTSQRHQWAEKARAGDPHYQAYYYMYDDRRVPDLMEQHMPDIFPESAPGSFTWVESCQKWVMTVFHSYQWDLNYSQPRVLVEMMDNILFYANLGVDVLRIDAPAFIWKAAGTTCQNLPMAHTLLRLIRLCSQIAAPGMALLGEAIVAPKDIMKYFGEGEYAARECDLAYHATQMALQWDALATADTRVMLAAQHDLLQKPYGPSWITYTRCHDDIGLGYEDESIVQAGFDPYEHRKFLKNYYSGNYPGSPSKGALFSVNPKTQDARISGSLASLCGLEKALENADTAQVELSIRKILLMQAMSCLIGGIPMLFYGDETGYTNDYSYLNDPGKSYDNRWMHRPLFDWEKNARRSIAGTVEQRIFSATQQLLALRRSLPVLAELNNLRWMASHNLHIAAFLRQRGAQRLWCLFNFSAQPQGLSWYVFREQGSAPLQLRELLSGQDFEPAEDHQFLLLEPYQVCVFAEASA